MRGCYFYERHNTQSLTAPAKWNKTVLKQIEWFITYAPSFCFFILYCCCINGSVWHSATAAAVGVVAQHYSICQSR